MAESVYIPLAVSTVQEAAELPSKTYRLDLEEGRILGMVDGQEAVRQAIHKAIITPRWKCLIYDNQYGSEIEAAVIQSHGSASQDYIKTVVPGFVRDALRPDKRISKVSNFVFAFSDEEKAEYFPDLVQALEGDEVGGDSIFVCFDAETIYGAVKVKEVI
jgi:hypothetical protein